MNVIFGRENRKIAREEGFWRNLAAKMKKLSAKEDFAWERRSQAPGFFPKLTWGCRKKSQHARLNIWKNGGVRLNKQILMPLRVIIRVSGVLTALVEGMYCVICRNLKILEYS